jgi:hypothetical protein
MPVIDIVTGYIMSMNQGSRFICCTLHDVKKKFAFLDFYLCIVTVMFGKSLGNEQRRRKKVRFSAFN